MRKIETAVVTGPTGAIGQALCRRLLDEGIRVVAVCHHGGARAFALPSGEGFTRVFCDLEEYAKLASLVSGTADAFFHFAWSNTTGSGRNDMTAQVRNIQHALEACRIAAQLGCQVFIGAGSQAEYGRTDCALAPDTPCFPENGYGMAKLCAGQMTRVECRSLGIDHIWPRILSVYGPYDGKQAMVPSVIHELLQGKAPALTAGEQLWDYLYADDAADALYRMALHGKDGAVYPLGSGAACPLREYIEELRDAIDPSLPLGFGEVAYGPQQVMHLQADISALQRDTGFAPSTDFSTGIRKTIEWVRSQEQGR